MLDTDVAPPLPPVNPTTPIGPLPCSCPSPCLSSPPAPFPSPPHSVCQNHIPCHNESKYTACNVGIETNPACSILEKTNKLEQYIIFQYSQLLDLADNSLLQTPHYYGQELKSWGIRITENSSHYYGLYCRHQILVRWRLL